MDEIVDGFDTEKFIDEIKNRPALWDSESLEYGNRDLKAKCWNEIIIIIGGSNLTPSQRRIMQISLRRKWKGLRGCYTRELKRQQNLRLGQLGARKSVYTHFQQLSFLRNVVSSRTNNTEKGEYLAYEDPDESKVKHENSRDQFEDEEVDNEQEFEEASSEYSKADDTNIDLEDKDPLRDFKHTTIKKPRIERVSEEDEDLLFLMSMLKTLQRVPIKKKMATKIKLMSVLDEATQDQ